MVLFATFFFPLGNKLVDKFNGESRPVIVIGGLVSLTFVTACIEFKLSPVLFIIVYSLGMGIFKGFLQSALLRAGWSHLPERKGLVSGAIISGYGFGGFLFGNFAKYLANPDDIKYVEDPVDGNMYLPAEVGNNLPYMMRILSLTWLCQVIVGLILITNYHSKESSKINSSETESLLTETEEEIAERELPIKKIICSPKFATLFVLGVSHLFYGYFYSNEYKNYGKDYINDDAFLTNVGAIASLFNGFFKFAWSYALDFYPFRRVYGGLIILEIFLIFAI